MGNTLTVENPAVQCYALCSSILVMKILLMAPLTTRQRFSKKVFASVEDEKFLAVKSSGRLVTDDPDVERVRRAHLNDLENIPAFIFISGLYLLTNPASGVASMLMKTYTGCRILHSLVYAAFANPEDAIRMGKVKVDDDVERVRRAHLNDLENIPVFIVVCTVYLMTNPSLSLAANLIRIFALARIAHSVVYAVVVIPQPARALSFGIGCSITIYMAVMSLMHFIPSM
ncbi:prostaglandin E synthase-like [Arctopsyche grandis]|uniref:prostaglandin E synthase-like n=1 Tax=Arctopsyche grandis TaxID=121162 RepID=UPI00406D9A23